MIPKGELADGESVCPCPPSITGACCCLCLTEGSLQPSDGGSPHTKQVTTSDLTIILAWPCNIYQLSPILVKFDKNILFQDQLQACPLHQWKRDRLVPAVLACHSSRGLGEGKRFLHLCNYS